MHTDQRPRLTLSNKVVEMCRILAANDAWVRHRATAQTDSEHSPRTESTARIGRSI